MTPRSPGASLPRALLQLLEPVPRRSIGGLLALMVVVALSEGSGLLLLVPILERLQGGTPQAGARLLGRIVPADAGLGLLLVVFVGLVALRSGAMYLRDRLGLSLQHRVVDALRQRCFSALLAAEWTWLAGTRRSDHASLLLGDVDRVGVGLNQALALLATLATIAAYLAAACCLSWPMTALALATGAVVLRLLAARRREALQLGRSLGSANRAMQRDVQDSLAGVRLAKLFGAEPLHLARFADATARLRLQQQRFSAGMGASALAFQVGGAIWLTVCLWVGLGVLHAALATMLTLVLLFARLIPPFMAAQQQLHQCLHALPALEEAQSLLHDCVVAAEPVDKPGRPLPAMTQGLRLQHVSVAHASRTRAALVDIDVLFPARTTTLVTGRSGAGKSTLADLLTGLLTPHQGVVSVDGVAIDAGNRRAWRNRVAYVQQDTLLFNESVADNLRRANPEATDGALEAALRGAAADFVFELPEGLQTVVGDGGARISGGERQRLTLARALLRRPSLLVLDEATSALDADNAARIHRAIDDLHGTLTIVVISHRIDPLHHVDQVLVLDGGRVVARQGGDAAAIVRSNERDAAAHAAIAEPLP